MEIILASNSPRRRELLTMMGLRYTAAATDCDESHPAGLEPAGIVMELAARKAHAARGGADTLVIAADTLVLLDGVLLGKPKDDAEALFMLGRLNSRVHEVFTGVCVRLGTREERVFERTAVRFAANPEQTLRAYVATGEPRDKAGAYGIQGPGAVLVAAIEGDFYNVMGLPVCALAACLRRFGVCVL